MFVTDWANRTDAEANDPPVPRRPSHERGVLVVDDIAAIRDLLEVILRSHGCSVWQAADGHQAEEAFRSNADRVSLILMDVHMPGGDGPPALRGIRRMAPHIPCWFMTTDAGAYSDAELRESGAQGVLSKPLRFDEIGRLAEAVLSGGDEGEPGLDRWADDGGSGHPFDSEPIADSKPTPGSARGC